PQTLGPRRPPGAPPQSERALLPPPRRSPPRTGDPSMSTLSYAVRDSATMLRRDFRHSLRYPMMTITSVALPIFYLLLFAGVFGNTLRAGLGAATPADGHYVDYLAPAIIVLTGCASA